MQKTFAQLELQETVTAKELIDVLRDYVVSGAAIDYHVVNAIYDRTQPDKVQREVLKELAQTGCEQQQALRHHAAMYHYSVVHSHIALGIRAR